ncbi:tRNA (adenosine(37)-N6)-dimethylallyltransferase MiaA [Shimia litoralis]|uniref:tRNA dimethylallyltransferase n=1 Tax=Shimia litoralis TaxID=420403 RepID=A0A4V6YFK1_9RHOB|nr:tRNA (adenosine(37)-N6)-dimethylallyltransferase MiaA [Shimia litoralis]TKZ20651.1 tRNA (adenosine(37)-N6)-dimethylallyltransferase MiaA [Shimia litoralis]
MTLMSRISPEQPVLIAGPTASGKSALALEIAESQGGVIVNADAIQVYDNWRVLTARPSIHDETCAKHLLYGHIPYDSEYSVGHWLRDVSGILAQGLRPIIVGGTGLYFTALTQGLADIPATPADLRTRANARVAAEGYQALLAELDAETKARIDIQNPMRVQRAWEVLTATGRPLAVWQDETPPPMLPVKTCVPVLFDVDKEWLNARIARRFAQMIKLGALEEARSNLAHWNPTLLSSKAIGAPELMGYLQGTCTLEDAQEKATVATRQFAKRQRTWFRSKMKNWHKYNPEL